MELFFFCWQCSSHLRISDNNYHGPYRLPFVYAFYLYFLAPGPFRRVLRGEYSVPLQAPVVWNIWAIAGILSLAVAIVLSVRCLATAKFESKLENKETA